MEYSPAPLACLRLTTIIKSVLRRRTVLLYCAAVPSIALYPVSRARFPICPRMPQYRGEF